MTTLKELNDMLTRLGINTTAKADGWNPEMPLHVGWECGPITTKELIEKVNQALDQRDAGEDQIEKLTVSQLKSHDAIDESNKLMDKVTAEVNKSTAIIVNMARAYNQLRAEHTALKAELETAKKRIQGSQSVMDAYQKALEQYRATSDLDLYQEDALRTYKDSGYRNAMIMGAIGLAGEVGEVSELIKKNIFHDKEFTKDQLVKELGDVLWYLAVMARTVAGVSLREIADTNITKLKARYPEGFDTTKANNRAPGDV